MAEDRGWGRELSGVAFAVLAVVVFALLCSFLVFGGTSPRLFDFHTFWMAGRAYLHGRDPYPAAIHGSISRGDWFVYPAPVAALFAPLGALPYPVATALMTGLLVAAAAGSLWLLGVRDWRCYVLAFGCLPLLKALNLGTVTPLLMLGVASCWRLRNRSWPLAAALTAAVLLKLLLWPLLIWAFVTGRRRASGHAVLVLCAVSLLAWLPIMHSLARYPSLLHQLAGQEAWAGYGLAGLAASFGASHAAAALIATCAVPIVCIAVWQAARRLSERRALAVTVALAVVASPVVWAHYFALVTICIALCSPTLSFAWFVPLAFWLTPGQQAWSSGWRIALGLAVLAFSLALPDSQGSRSATREPSTDLRGIVGA